MSFEGMDVDQLQSLAKQIDSDAQALYNLVNTLNGVTGALTLIWHGPVAATFEQEWQSRNRPALLAAYNTLMNLHGHLVSNINQQKSASAAEGGWTLDRIIGDVRTAWTAWEPVAQRVGYVQEALDKFHELAGKHFEPGAKEFKEYDKGWSKLIQLDHDSSLLKYHEWSVLRYAHDASYLQKADKVLAHTRIADLIPVVGAVLTLPDAIVNTGEAIVDLKDHHYNSAIMHAGNVAEDEGGLLGVMAGGATRLLAGEYELGKQMGQTHEHLSLGQEAGKQFGLVVNAFFG